MTSGSTLPSFSVVVPTHNRLAQLRDCLEALAAQDYPGDRYDVIVVDDGSSVSPVEVVASLRPRIRISLVTQANSGPGAARNQGAALATGQFLAFIDDDCVPGTNWLRALSEKAVDAPDQLLGGRTENLLPDNLYSTASQLLNSYIYEYFNTAPGLCRFFASNNLCVPATEFRAMGGFDTILTRWASEDREFCDRWIQGGGAMTYVPDALVYHAHHLALVSFWRQHHNYGRGAVQFRRARARRTKESIPLEPPSFYAGLLRYPFRVQGGARGLCLVVLTILAQMAMAAGFLQQKCRV